MLINASVRPRGIKRGVSDKKLAKSIGLEHADLRDMVGRLELSVTNAPEFAFLRELYNAFHPWKEQASKITIEIAGKKVIEYTQEPKKP